MMNNIAANILDAAKHRSISEDRPSEYVSRNSFTQFTFIIVDNLQMNVEVRNCII